MPDGYAGNPVERLAIYDREAGNSYSLNGKYSKFDIPSDSFSED